jgi:CubicO group peptidase (beta-lactamase class C family)
MIMRRAAIALLLLPLWASVLLAQQPARTTSPSDELASYERALASAYSADAPGAVALVAKGGEVVYRGAAGLANLELGVPLEPDMVFEIGSIT